MESRFPFRSRPAVVLGLLPSLVIAVLAVAGPAFAQSAPKRGAPPPLWDDGDEAVPDLRRGSPDRRPGAAPDPKAPVPPGAKPGTPTPPKGGTVADGPTWAILITSFTQDDHVDAARLARDRIAAQFPALSDCYTRRVSKGSVVVVGRFAGPSDPAAQKRLKEVKAITVDGARPFAGVILTRTAATDESRPPSPYDIRRLRDLNPDVNPLYTLQVAAWSTFGDRSLKWTDVRASAERYCGELRAKGFLSFVHHDDDAQISSVTVGAFGKDAYDPRSTLFDAEVEQLMRKFPKHLVNGEEVLIPVDPRRPEGPKRAQACRLVEVPK